MAGFLVDENLPRSLVADLEAAGHEATHVADVGLRGKPDVEVFGYAVANGLSIISVDQSVPALTLQRRSFESIREHTDNSATGFECAAHGGLVDAAGATTRQTLERSSSPRPAEAGGQAEAGPGGAGDNDGSEVSRVR